MKDFFGKLSFWYFSKSALPYWCVILIDCCIIVVSGLVGTYFSIGGGALASQFWVYVALFCCTLPLFVIGMRLFHTYSGIIRYSSFVDLIRVVGALMVGGILVLLLRYALLDCLPVTVLKKSILIALLMATVLQCTMRILVKCIFDTAYQGNDVTRVFIYGVRDGGISIAKSMRNEHPIRNVVKGFVANDEKMWGRYLVGKKVYAPDDKLVGIMKEFGVKAIYISPRCSDQFRENDELVNQIIKAGIKIKMLPSAETWDGKSRLSHSQLHEVDIEDLLPREKIEVDLKAIGDLLSGKRILITGAAGSIGSEMARQVAMFNPSELVLIDQAETPMHDVRLYMSRNHPDLHCQTIVTSICRQERMEKVFEEFRPEYVFHAAAYKHVPMMEDNPSEAILNNVYGTRVIADLAVKYGTKKFVMISTDKAVNPTNVMGCSKRICEIYCQSLNAKLHAGEGDTGNGKTQFITTRFGNVLGSNGSVIPIFKEQIRKGGPITVTHPDIIRFFMLIPEACRLVLEAGTMGHGGEIFVFDMGKPVRIADLAQRMITLSGAQGVEIKFTGLRDGEKLYEEVLNDKETTKPTIHPKIMIADVRKFEYDKALADEIELHGLALTFDDMAIVRKMKEIVPEYRSQNSKYQSLDK